MTIFFARAGLQILVTMVVFATFITAPYCQDSGSATLYIERGTQLWRRADYSAAISNYTKAIEIDEALVRSGQSSDSDVKRLGNTYLLRARVSRILQSFKAAFEDINRYLRLFPESAEGYLEQGFTHKSAGNAPEAIASYTKAIQINPQYAQAYKDRGYARGDIGDSTGALDDFDKSITIEPTDSQAYFFRGITRANLRDYEGAIADYTKIIELVPGDWLAYKLRAQAYLVLGRNDEAERDFRRCIELKPDERPSIDVTLKRTRPQSTP